MPRFVNTDHKLVEREDVERMIRVLPDLEDRALIVFLWLFGPKPSEVIRLKLEDVEITPTQIIVRLGEGKKRRELRVWRGTPRDWLIEEFVRFIELLKKYGYRRVFHFGYRQGVNQVCKNASVLAGLNLVVSPTTFRYNRAVRLLSELTEEGTVYWLGLGSKRALRKFLGSKPPTNAKLDIVLPDFWVEEVLRMDPKRIKQEVPVSSDSM